MLRGGYLKIVLGVGAGFLASSCSAWADKPTATNLQSPPPVYIGPGPILADPSLDRIPAPSVGAGFDSGAWNLAQTGCRNPATKDRSGRDRQTSPQSNCPIDVTKIGGVQEIGAGPSIEQIDFNQFDFSSPIYTTFKGQLFGTTEFNFTKSSLELFQSGAKIGSQRGSDLELTEVLRYGVTDALSIEASISESPSDVVKEVSYGVSSKAVSQGWQDPGLIVVYRALSQPSSPIYLDFTAEYYPNAFQSSPATGTQEFIFEESFGHAFGNLTLEGIAETTWVGEGNDGIERTPSFWNEQYEVEAFYRISDRWSASIDVENQLVGHTDGPFSAHGQINYYIVPDKLQATLEYERGFAYNDPPPALGPYGRHQQSDTVGIRLGYLFDIRSNSK